jgi:hypothetical protein
MSHRQEGCQMNQGEAVCPMGLVDYADSRILYLGYIYRHLLFTLPEQR